MKNECWNCKDILIGYKRFKLCPVCQRTYGLGLFVGGLVVGIAVRLLS